MIDTLLHGVALGSLLATLAATLRSRSSNVPLWTFRLFCLSASGFVAFTSPLAEQLSGAAYLAVRLLSAIGVGAFWLFALALFSQRKLNTVYAIPLIVLAGLALPEAVISRPALLATKIMYGAVETLLLGDVVVVAWRDAKDDLVNARYVLRAPLIFGIALACLALTGLKLATLLGFPHDWLRTIQALVSTVLALAGASAFSQERSRLFEGSRRSARASASPSQAQYDALLTKLKILSEDDRVWRRPNLTIGEIAGQLSVPEHRLRQVINRHLDYRNFSEFVNERRINIAKRELRDPERISVQIAAIAFDLGYASLGPFNRAFREQTGMSPRIWRNQPKDFIGRSLANSKPTRRPNFPQ